jgi:hypothetical protein
MDNPEEFLHRYCQCVVVITCIVLIAADLTLQPLLLKEPYHTSALTGEAWVLELLAGHPERIHCELGVHRHVFDALIAELRSLGHQKSRHVSLEEQLAIFLYASVTGSTVRHVGERFQRSSETISRYVDNSSRSYSCD